MKPASSTRLAIVAEKVADSISQKLHNMIDQYGQLLKNG
jgi:hypothetical protein